MSETNGANGNGDGAVVQGKSKGPSDEFRAHQFKPGQSGNPRGRPKGVSIMERIAKILDQPSGEGRTVADDLADAIVSNARSDRYGSSLAKELLDRFDGPVRQEVAYSHEETIKVLRGVDDEAT